MFLASSTSQTFRSRTTAALMWGVRAVALVWASLWSVLAVLAAIGSAERDLLFGLGAALAVCVPVVIAWGAPRAGGLALVGVAVLSAMAFGSGTAWATLSVPAALLGGGFLLVGWARRRTALADAGATRSRRRTRPRPSRTRAPTGRSRGT